MDWMVQMWCVRGLVLRCPLPSTDTSSKLTVQRPARSLSLCLNCAARRTPHHYVHQTFWGSVIPRGWQLAAPSKVVATSSGGPHSTCLFVPPFVVRLYCTILTLYNAEYLVAVRLKASFLPRLYCCSWLLCHFQGPKTPSADKEEGRYGFLGRAFQEAKRVGMAIDPEAVTQAEQAWKVRNACAVDGYVCGGKISCASFTETRVRPRLPLPMLQVANLEDGIN